jgi:signal transduction histidine kinase/ActR/RegA family two-component response regulator
MPLRRYAVAIAAAWTLVLGASLAWNLLQIERSILALATVQAEGAYQKDLVYRRWNAGQGGVYVVPSEATPPSPYLAHLPDRDLTTTDGRRLTLVNPAYMTRQVHELGRGQYGLQGHITSLRPLRPENGPDPWESAALARFEREDIAKISAEGRVADEPVLRFMGRLVTEERCLKCHASQGYRVGEVRGGISVTVPLTPLRASMAGQARWLGVGHLGLWAVGLLGMGWASRRLRQRVLEREAALAALRSAEHQLAHTRRLEAVGQLAGGVAHDLNNLLSPILGHASMALEELPPGSALREDLAAVKGAAERARDLTRRLLVFSRKQPLEVRPVDLSATVSDVLGMLGRIVGEQVRLETRLAERLPAVRVDRGQVEVALVNLATNARDAMPQGGTLRIATGEVVLGEAEAAPLAVPAGRYVTIEVQDSGTGIADDVLAHLFEPFYTTKPIGRGTGLGLASVHGVVRQHGGAVQVETAPGRGTTFRLLLPATDEPAADSEPGPPAAPRGDEQVLVVEDDDGVRRFVVQALGGLGYQVASAEDAERALALARARGRPFDLLVTDVVMPGRSGRELLEQLGREGLAARVLYLSGYPRDVFGDHATPAGGAPLLAKPFTAQDLGAAVRRALDGPVPPSVESDAAQG